MFNVSLGIMILSLVASLGMALRMQQILAPLVAGQVTLEIGPASVRGAAKKGRGPRHSDIRGVGDMSDRQVAVALFCFSDEHAAAKARKPLEHTLSAAGHAVLQTTILNVDAKHAASVHDPRRVLAGVLTPLSARRLKGIGPLLAPGTSVVLGLAERAPDGRELELLARPGSQHLVLAFDPVEHGAVLEAVSS